MVPPRRPWAAFHRSTVRISAVTSRSLTVGCGPRPWRAGRGTRYRFQHETVSGPIGLCCLRGDPRHHAGQRGQAPPGRRCPPAPGPAAGRDRTRTRQAGPAEAGRRRRSGLRADARARGVPVGGADRGEQGQAGDAVEGGVVGLQDHDIVLRSHRQDHPRRGVVQGHRPGGQLFPQRGQLTGAAPAGHGEQPGSRAALRMAGAASQRRRRLHREVAARCRRAEGSAASTRGERRLQRRPVQVAPGVGLERHQRRLLGVLEVEVELLDRGQRPGRRRAGRRP